MILYKYLPPDRLQLLKNNSFRFTQPNKCNDPLECMPRTILVKNIEEAKKHFAIMECQARISGCQFPPGAEEQWIDSVIPNVQHSPNDLQLQQEIQDLNSKTLGILCLAEKPDKFLMWSHYGKCHTGFAVGIDSEHEWFKDLAPNAVFGNVRKVVYSAKRPEIPSQGEIDFSFLYHKGTDWAYEDEYRFILPLRPYCRETNPDSGIFVRQFPRDLIKSVVFGYRMDPELETDIRATLSNLDVDFLRAEPSSVTYDMELTPV